MEAFIHPNLVKLTAGIKSFQQRAYASNDPKMKHLLDYGQQPKILVICCSDSRVDPALLMDVEAGDLFMLRHVANLVPPYALEGKYDGGRSSIEYAVRDLL
ncbi:MAG: carbonic anhydrase, partial [Methylovulum sp.]|nr:carbonic anhydrase [Methylovulum sp.]